MVDYKSMDRYITATYTITPRDILSISVKYNDIAKFYRSKRRNK